MAALDWLGVLILAIAVAAYGIIHRRNRDADLHHWTAAQAIPTVAVVTPERGVKGQEMVLPGAIEANYEAQIYARVSGYVKMWYQDIGARVKAGQVLADIDTPELDQQLIQAKADVTLAEANAALATLTAKRWQSLLSTNAVSQQTTDEKLGDAAAKKAQVAAATANVQRLEALEGFKRIIAPFDGIVTARRTDIGALVNAGNGGQLLFSVADIHKMRVYVRVPQSMSTALQPNMTAILRLPQYPGRSFTAKLATTANAVNAESRTVLAEFMADNQEGTLWPGTYAEAHIQLPASPDILSLPSSALLFRQNGLKVAIVGPDNKVILKPITIGRDLGPRVEVAAGVSPDDRVIDSPSDAIADGDPVQIALPAKPSNPASTPPAAAPNTTAGAEP